MNLNTDVQSLEKAHSLKGESSPGSNESVEHQHSGSEDGFPDGGLRAWLVVAGVRVLNLTPLDVALLTLNSRHLVYRCLRLVMSIRLV